MIVELLGVAKSKGLTPAQTVLFLALTEMLEGGQAVCLQMKEICEATGLAGTTVKDGMKALEDAGILERAGKFAGVWKVKIRPQVDEIRPQVDEIRPQVDEIRLHIDEKRLQVDEKRLQVDEKRLPSQPPALPSPFAPPLGIPPYNPPNLPTPQPACARERPAQGGGEKEREEAGSFSGIPTAENAPESPTQPAPISGNAPNYPLECPKFPFVTQGGISLPPTAQNRVKGHFTPEERDFLKTYGKQPLTNDAFNQFVTAFSEAVQDVGLQRLVECARMEVENVRAENGGSSQKLRRPEVWLADLAYRDWLTKIPATPNQPTASTDAYMRYLDTLDLGL